MKTLIAGPWVGEFGWELFCWQGYLRKYVKEKKIKYCIVIGRDGHQALYDDFADEYKVYNPKSNETNMWRCNGESLDIPTEMSHELNNLTPFEVVRIKPTNLFNMEQEFINYSLQFDGFSKLYSYDILYHARSTNKFNTGYRDWLSEDLCDYIRRMYNDITPKRIAAIGSKEQSIHIPGTDDLRGISLLELMKIMKNSLVMIGPLSGPIHMASLCGLPHITWTTRDENIKRIKEKWNPFETRAHIIKAPVTDGHYWCPNTGILSDLTYRFMNGVD